MDQINIDTLPAGQEMDALVAEKVMGLEITDYAPIGIRKGGWVLPIPAYSTNIAAAWEVFEKLKTLRCRGWSAIGPNHKVACHEPETDLWCVFDSGSTERIKFSKFGQGPTPMLAICRAALKAIYL